MTQPRDEIVPVDIWLDPVPWENRRSLRRIDATLPAALDRPDQIRREVTLADISTHGCRVAADGLRVGDRVRLHLPATEPVSAYVAWTGRDEVGLEFRRPLDPAVVAQIAGD